MTLTELLALAKKVAESQKNDTRTPEEIVSDGVKFITECPLGEQIDEIRSGK